MSQSGYTPILSYSSATASAVPLAANLSQGELAVNTNDGKLFYKDSSGVVQTMASKATGAIGGSTTQVQFNNSGVLGGSANLTFNGTTLTAAGLAGPHNGTVGATTPATGAFTTVTATGGVDKLTTASGVVSVAASAAPTAGQVLTATSGTVATWQTPTTVSVAGSDTQVQYNNSGAFGASSNFTWNNSTKLMYLQGPGTSLASTLQISDSAALSDTRHIKLTRSSANAYIGIAASQANDPLWLSRSGGYDLLIDPSGNVGVGTTSPTSGLQTAGSSSKSAFKTPNIAEVNTVSATAASGTIQYDVTTQSVLYYTSNASANWTVNFRGSSGTSLNTVMQTGESISVTFLATQGATAYYNSAVTIDGTSVTPKWQGGTAPTSGNASSIDSYNYVIIKVGSGSFTVLASVTKFA